MLIVVVMDVNDENGCMDDWMDGWRKKIVMVGG
jgi:hypothetical protein